MRVSHLYYKRYHLNCSCIGPSLSDRTCLGSSCVGFHLIRSRTTTMLLSSLLVCLTYGFGLGTTKGTCYRKLYLLPSDGLTEGQPVWVWGAPGKACPQKQSIT
jgi:hypothetical protein